MKLFIAALYGLFLVAMISGIFIAFRTSEGLVESDYYLKQKRWFSQKSEERKRGIGIDPPASIRQGENELTFVLTEGGKPLKNAKIQLFIGNISSKSGDQTCPMHETAPGVYQTKAFVASAGKWLVRLDFESSTLNSSRSWFYDVH